MTVMVEEWQGVKVPRSAEPIFGKFFRITIPREWVEMKALSGFSKTLGHQSAPNDVTIGFVPWLEKRAGAIFGEQTPIDFYWSSDAASVVSTPAMVEWLAEEQGLAYTARFKRGINVDDVAEVDDTAVLIFHTTHVAVKMASEEARMLLEIKLGEYATSHNARSSIVDIA